MECEKVEDRTTCFRLDLLYMLSQGADIAKHSVEPPGSALVARHHTALSGCTNQLSLLTGSEGGRVTSRTGM